MMRRMKTWLVIIALCVCGITSAAAQTAPAAVRVGVYVAPPFIMKSGDSYTGFTWDLWQQIASDLKLTYNVREVGTVADLLKQIRDGQIDIGVANLSITADRYKMVDFTQPYFDSGLRIMINEDRSTSLSGIISGLRQGGHLRVYAWIGILIIVGTIVLTLIDRRFHPEFPKEWGKGLAESFHHVMSVATSGSTSHRNLMGSLGTVIGAIWLACGVAVVAYVTSSVTSVMTASTIAHQINGFNDLGNKRVGVVAGSSGETFSRTAMLNVQPYDSMDTAVADLVKGKIDAIVRDAPVLEWYDNSHPALPLTEVGPIFQPDKYGFALAKDSPLTRPISEDILRLGNNGMLDTLHMRYFGRTR